MADQGIKTPLDPSFVARVAAGLKYAFTGKGLAWFGPGEPMEPVAPVETKGRRFDYPTGYDLTTAPRRGEAIGFPQLRALADNYDLLRLVLETRKDQIAKMNFEIKGKDGGKIKETDPRIEAVKAFLAYPDRIHDWDAWLRIILEDMLVLDAPTIYPRRTLGGDLYSLEPVDGATISCLIDAHGRTPAPPDPAYQQSLKGLPATEYTTDELIYLPRNPRAHKVYGYSPVEQIIMTVNIALRRQLSQLEYYTDGNVADALFKVPDSWTNEQIKTFQGWWDSLLSGNTAERRRAKFIPAVDPIFPREAVLKDDYDEWLARIVCYCFSVPPTPFVKMMNRATAASVQESALQEGLIPLLKWVRSLINYIIAFHFRFPDLEFIWKTEKDIDPLVAAQIGEIDVRVAVRTLDEVREERGLPPYPNGMGKEPLVYTASGPVLLSEALKPPEPTPPALLPFTGEKPGGDGGKAPVPGGPEGKGVNGGAPGEKTPPGPTEGTQVAKGADGSKKKLY